MTAKYGDFIKGGSQVFDYYGNWPTFHDADYVSITIDMHGPTISINFRLYDWNDLLQEASRPNITLVWHEIKNLNLSGIQELGQNAIGQMKIDQTNESDTAP